MSFSGVVGSESAHARKAATAATGYTIGHLNVKLWSVAICRWLRYARPIASSAVATARTPSQIQRDTKLASQTCLPLGAVVLPNAARTARYTEIVSVGTYFASWDSTVPATLVPFSFRAASQPARVA